MISAGIIAASSTGPKANGPLLYRYSDELISYNTFADQSPNELSAEITMMDGSPLQQGLEPTFNDNNGIEWTLRAGTKMTIPAENKDLDKWSVSMWVFPANHQVYDFEDNTDSFVFYIDRPGDYFDRALVGILSFVNTNPNDRSYNKYVYGYQTYNPFYDPEFSLSHYYSNFTISYTELGSRSLRAANHITLVYDNSQAQKIKMYRNGNFASSGGLPADTLNILAKSNMYIQAPSVDTTFKDLRVYNYALSQTEVETIYNDGFVDEYLSSEDRAVDVIRNWSTNNLTGGITFIRRNGTSQANYTIDNFYVRFAWPTWSDDHFVTNNTFDLTNATSMFSDVDTTGMNSPYGSFRIQYPNSSGGYTTGTSYPRATSRQTYENQISNAGVGKIRFTGANTFGNVYVHALKFYFD